MKTRLVKHTYYLVLLFFIMSSISWAQKNSAARYEIDAKRTGVSYEDKDALPRSREFIRLDSTYYVGWMMEGMYKFERSSDYLGYKQALQPLTKALRLLEKDYKSNLESLFSSISFFIQNQNRFNDFYELANTLKMCYNNIEMPDSTMKLLDKIEGYHFQRDFFGIDCDRAWLYHRNRFFTSAQHPFLKNSIDENVDLALNACYKQIETIKKNKNLNDYWYGPNQSDEDFLTVYHYLAIMHNYRQRYDSAEYYYRRLIDGRRISWSNYANTQHEVGLFADAMENYKKVQYRRRFSLVESDYYMPTLLVYAGNTKDAILQTNERIMTYGSTPGFGWYNIALARGYLYDGQLDSCDFFLNKAFQFKELHIGTTLTQSQYEFTINLLRVQLIDKRISLIKFFNTGWWYSPSDLYDMYLLKSEKAMLEYALVNALVHNPERVRLVYDLFCAEATVSFDESTYLLKDFCLPYFKKRYAHYADNDQRLRINKYFKLLVARFTLEDGDEDEAKKEAETLLQETVVNNNNDEGLTDMNYEHLFVFRLLEVIGKAENDDEKKNAIAVKCFETYPQLLPFSELKTQMIIDFNGLENDAVIKDIKDDLSDCNIEQVTQGTVPKAMISVEKRGTYYRMVINVTNHEGNLVVENNELLFKTSEGVGHELALRLFNKGGAVKFESVKKNS